MTANFSLMDTTEYFNSLRVVRVWCAVRFGASGRGSVQRSSSPSCISSSGDNLFQGRSL